MSSQLLNAVPHQTISYRHLLGTESGGVSDRVCGTAFGVKR